MQCLLVDEVHFFNRYRAVLSEQDVCTHLCDNCMLSSELLSFTIRGSTVVLRFLLFRGLFLLKN